MAGAAAGALGDAREHVEAEARIGRARRLAQQIGQSWSFIVVLLQSRAPPATRPPARDVRFHRAQRQPQRLGGFPVGEVLAETQRQRRALIGGKIVHRPPERKRLRCARMGLGRRVARVPHIRCRAPGGARESGATRRQYWNATPQMKLRKLMPIETVQHFPGARERFLRKIVGVGGDRRPAGAGTPRTAP